MLDSLAYLIALLIAPIAFAFRLLGYIVKPAWIGIHFLEETLYAYYKIKLHKKRKHYINESITRYVQNQPAALPADINQLVEKLETEANRVYAIVDRSILRDRIKRSTRETIILLVTSILIVGILGGFTSGSMTIFLSPILMSFAYWFRSIYTISISYNQRVKGAFDTVVNAALQNQDKATVERHDYVLHEPLIHELVSSYIRDNIRELIQPVMQERLEPADHTQSQHKLDNTKTNQVDPYDIAEKGLTNTSVNLFKKNIKSASCPDLHEIALFQRSS